MAKFVLPHLSLAIDIDRFPDSTGDHFPTDIIRHLAYVDALSLLACSLDH